MDHEAADAGYPTDDSPGASFDAATAVFAQHRELLFSIAYNILGTVADTEDVLQETWLSWAAADRSTVGNVRAYLVRIAVNQAMSRLRRVQRNRETYVGPWLPEPLVTDTDAAEGALRAESVSLALMVVLETLTPLERAVFVLHEAFGYGHNEIAKILDRSPAAVRQLAHRAREHVEARRPRTAVDPEARKAVTERFIAAAAGGDLNALLDVLAPDVAMWTDAGGKTKAARQVVTGRDKVARLLTSDKIHRELEGLTVRSVLVNGEPALAMYTGDRMYAIGVVDVSDDGAHVSGIYGILNPDKLESIAESMHRRGV
ncbi:RNA polymerase sigma factor SigJ [Phytoactinopolyspora halotolerans]|uniref:Sigma-70 family RNA polymerase sigma factor n=1 Tax=Phytoactinopolyspora halotolerans TaxID=1981512 RepID=A0A6L9S098_9ACTN|nr:RNA polymerase sigma factor SigJ [Phytoactinopolyspora halotolerans]NED98635.1 sigma-70 family RNA polymerase sigma factor [Phytoactinopolyspora halotolerans]